MRAILIEGNPSAAERVKETFASGGDSRARTHSPLELIKPLAHLWGLCRRILPRDPLQRRPPARQLDPEESKAHRGRHAKANGSATSAPPPVPEPVDGRILAAITLDQFFSASPSPLAIWGFDNRIRAVNPAWELILGFTQKEVEGHSLSDFVHPEDQSAASAEFEKILAIGAITGFEFRARRKDGSYRWLLVAADVLKDQQAIYATAHDITKRKRAEEAMRDSEARFRSAFDNTLFGISITAMDGRFLQVNQGFCRITGFSEQELLQLSFTGLIHPDDARISLELRRELMEGAVLNGNRIKRYVRKNGEPVWVSVHLGMVRDSQGQPQHFITLVEDLTEQRRLEEDARRNQERLRFTLDAAGIGLCYREAGTSKASEQQFRLYGREPADEWLSRERWLQSIHPEDRERVETEERLATEQGRAYDAQFRVVWPDGSVHWLLCRGKISHDDGTDQRVEVTVEVTARKRAEAALEEFFSMSRSPMSILGFDGSTKRVNASLLRATGFTAEEFAQRPAFEFFHPDDRATMATEMQKLIARGGSTEFECRGLRKDGSVVPLIFTSTAAPDEKLIFTVAYDMTERKRAEEASRENERVLSESQSIAHAGSWSWELPTDTTAWSPETYRLFGVSPDTFVPSIDKFQGLIHPDDRAAMQAWIVACLAGEQPADLEFRVSLPDGNVRHILGRGRLEQDARNKPVRLVGIAQDVTQRKEMEEALRARAEKLARSNEELERFAYVASHDLQEPLRMVASFTKLLSQRYSGQLDETADRYINYAADGAKRMQALIIDLLAYSRVNSKELDLRNTSCETAVLGAMRNLKIAIDESGASVYWDPLPSLWMDLAQFTLLFQNLMSNAIKFRRNGESPRITISAADSGAEWVFSARDNGVGIEPRHAGKIFQIFQRLHTRAEYPGTGIGLAVCKKVVERHGGRIWVESEPGVGSTFSFTIPKIPGEASHR
jgi:PAS domain S-box-containing protein